VTASKKLLLFKIAFVLVRFSPGCFLTKARFENDSAVASRFQ